jgi:RNA polymerase sigma-70 factor, ECF subfamily
MIDKMTTPTDPNLMRSIAAGDKYAFQVLVSRHQRRVLNLIYRYLGDLSEAEDLAQEVFFRVWKSARTYKPKAKFTTWLYRITINLCINRQRSLRIRKWFTISESDRKILASEETFGSDGADRPTTPENNLIQSELQHQVKRALDGLPKNQRMAIILRIYDELSYQDIAKILGCSVSAVDSLLIRAKKNLRKKLPLQK